MRNRRRVRRMVVGGTVYGWCFSHRCGRVPGHPECRSTVTLWRPGSPARLRLVFRAGPDRAIADGFLDEGAAMRLSDRSSLSLHRPGSVRALLDEALTRERFPTAGSVVLDGWPLFDAVSPPAPPISP